MLALVAWVVLVESVDEVAGEEAAGGSDKRREREKDAEDGECCEAARWSSGAAGAEQLHFCMFS